MSEMIPFPGFLSRCCKAPVLYRDEIVAYGEHKGLHCSKCLEYCEVLQIRPPVPKAVVDVKADLAPYKAAADAMKAKQAELAPSVIVSLVLCIIDAHREPGMDGRNSVLDKIKAAIKTKFNETGNA